MARGNRREAIVLDDKDRDRFRKLLGDLVQQTGWEIFACERGGVPELPGDEKRSLQWTLRRSWMFGGEAFREGLIKRLDKLKKSDDTMRRRRSGYTGVQARDHGEAAALRLIALAIDLAGLENEDLEPLRKNDWRKRVIGRAVRRNTTVPAAWISEQLRMGNVVRCAALTAKDPDDSWEPNWKQARAMLKKMEKEYRNIDWSPDLHT